MRRPARNRNFYSDMQQRSRVTYAAEAGQYLVGVGGDPFTFKGYLTTVTVICFSAAMGDGPFLSGFGPLFLHSLIYLHIFKAFYLKTCLSLAKSEMAKSPWRGAATCWHLAAATSMQLLQETCCRCLEHKLVPIGQQDRVKIVQTHL